MSPSAGPGHGRDGPSERTAGDLGSPGRPVALRRWATLGSVLIVVVGLGLVDRLASPAPTASVSPAVIAAAPEGAESSSWYCAGSTGNPGGAAQGTVLVTNTTTHQLAASVVVTNGTTSTAVPLGLPALAETTFSPSQVLQGAWLAASVEVSGGGVVASQVVQGPTGWSESQCSSTTQANWYFASGSTASGASLTTVLFNPAATPAVVDATFFTTKGFTEPQPDQGIVVAPGQLVTLDVGSYVQDQSAVATLVSAQSGRIVASQLWTYSDAGQQGLSLQTGAPSLGSDWTLPLNENVAPHSADALNQLDVFNPERTAARVHVAVRLSSGALTPFVDTVGPGSTWHLRLDLASRIPVGTDYAVSVHSLGQVAVGRVVMVPSTSTLPQWGATPAVAPLPAGFGEDPSVPVSQPRSLGSHPLEWVVPAPATSAGAVLPGAAPSALSVQNLGSGALDVQVLALVDGKVQSLGRAGQLQVGAHGVAYLGSSTLTSVALDPLLVETSGRASVTEDLVPSGGTGTVCVAAAPLS